MVFVLLFLPRRYEAAVASANAAEVEHERSAHTTVTQAEEAARAAEESAAAAAAKHEALERELAAAEAARAAEAEARAAAQAALEDLRSAQGRHLRSSVV